MECFLIVNPAGEVVSAGVSNIKQSAAGAMVVSFDIFQRVQAKSPSRFRVQNGLLTDTDTGEIYPLASDD